MRRILFAAAVAVLALTASSSSALVMVANFTTAQKTVQADAVVLGKVTEIEKEEVEVLPFQGATDKVKMRVGVVKIETGLVGAKNVTHVKVLLPGAATEQPAQPLPGGGPAVRPLPGRGRVLPITLKDGEEGLFFLAKHPTAANYYTINAGNTPVLNKAENFKDEVTKVKAIVATLADPMTALKAEKIEDRLSAAATLVQKYRRGLSVPAKEEAIPAEETKAILKTLADADWTAANKPPKPGQVIDYQAQPANILSMIGLFPGSPNGLPRIQVKPGENYNAKYQEAFKAWYAASGDKFEIKKYVPKD
jgi:hypothetical protein